jgi:hypothetical protein
MSRGVSPNSTTYELVNSCNSFTKSICEKDVITNLKVQVFAKDQNKKNFQNLLSMYHNLEEEIAKISDEKRRHEIALEQLESDNKNTAIIDLKNKNENLFNELNEKIAINKKLYNENNKLFQELECRTAHSENLHDQMHEQEELIRKLSCDKDEVKNKVICLSQVKEKQENDIHNLTIQINKLNLQNDDQGNILKNKHGQNYEIIDYLNEEKNINKNLKIELQSTESTLMSSQQKLNRDNDNIHIIQSNINNITNIIKKNSEDISIINNNLLNETSIIKQLDVDKCELNNLIGDRDEHIKQLNNDNNIIKQNNSELNCQNNKIGSLLEAYKKHLSILYCQNKKLSNEIKCLLARDDELRTILQRDDHLREVRFENEQFMNNTNEIIRDNIDVGDTIVEKKTTIKRTYSIDGNNGLKIMDSPNIKKSVNNIERINSLSNRKITSNISENNNQRNNLQSSQEYLDINDNEMEEIP